MSKNVARMQQPSIHPSIHAHLTFISHFVPVGAPHFPHAAFIVRLHQFLSRFSLLPWREFSPLSAAAASPTPHTTSGICSSTLSHPTSNKPAATETIAIASQRASNQQAILSFTDTMSIACPRSRRYRRVMRCMAFSRCIHA